MATSDLPLSSAGRAMPEVSKLADLEEGRLRLVKAGEARIALLLDKGEVRALAALCTHSRIFLAPGRLGADGLIECPVHGAKFSPVDGAVRCPPATGPLGVHEVRVVAGAVHVDPEPAVLAPEPMQAKSASAWAKWS